MKILLVSDREESYIWDHFDKNRFSDVELILACGDLKAQYLSFLVTMINKPLFYVPGNHDKTYVNNPPEGCDSVDGMVVQYNGLRIGGLGGSMRYNLGPYQYTEEEMRARYRQLRPQIRRRKGLDIFISHAPALGLGDGRDLCHTGFQCFVDLLDKYQPKYFIHGHNHLEYGRFERIMKYNNTTIINACGYHILDTEETAAQG